MEKFKILFIVSLLFLGGSVIAFTLSFVIPAAAAPYCTPGTNCCLQEIPELGISCTPEYWCGPAGCRDNGYVVSQSSACAGDLKYNCDADACQCEVGSLCGTNLCCTDGTICCTGACQAALSGPPACGSCTGYFHRSLSDQCTGACGGCLEGYEDRGGAAECGYTICVGELPKVTLTPYAAEPDENTVGRDSVHINTPDGDFIINSKGHMMLGDTAMTINTPNNLLYGLANSGSGNLMLFQMPSGVDRFKVDLGGAVTASGDITAQSDLHVYGNADIDGSISTDNNLSVAGDIYIGANKAIIMNSGADTTLYIGNYIGGYDADIDVDGYGYFTKGVLTRVGSSSAFSGPVSITGASNYLSVQGYINTVKQCIGGGACTAAAGELCLGGDCRSSWPAGGGGDITDVLAGSGISVTNPGGPQPSVAIDSTYSQRRVFGSCAAGSSIRLINQDGTAVCESDDNSGGDITDILAGSGISVTNPSGPQPTVGIDYAQAQQRVSSGCAAGSSIRLINQDGTVVCEPDDDTGGIAGITAGTNIETISLGENVTINVVDSPTFADTVSMNDNLNVTGSIAGASLGVSGAISAATLETAGVIAVNGASLDATHGIRAQGSSAGAYFSDSNSSGYAYLGYGNYGISAAGSFKAGYFLETDTGTTVALGYGGNGIVTHGTASGGQFINDSSDNYAYLGTSSYGIAAYGSTAGGYFRDRDSNKYAYIAYGDYGGYFNGNLYVSGSCGPSGSSCDEDVAEYIDSNPDVEPADVVEIGADSKVHKSSAPYSTTVVGVISTNPAIIFPGGNQGDEKKANRQPLALSGVVPVKVSAENGAIRAGDLLTSSSTPGYAMRCDDTSKCAGSIIGKALESFNGETGIIKIIVTLQ